MKNLLNAIPDDLMADHVQGWEAWDLQMKMQRLLNQRALIDLVHWSRTHAGALADARFNLLHIDDYIWTLPSTGVNFVVEKTAEETVPTTQAVNEETRTVSTPREPVAQSP